MAQPQQPSDPVDDVVLASSSTGNAEGVQVSLHPLPLLSISEHYTRVRVQNEHDGRKDIRGGSTGEIWCSSLSPAERRICCLTPAAPAVIGALIGIQQGREVEIVNSFELATNPEGTEVNHDFFVQRQSQCEQLGSSSWPAPADPDGEHADVVLSCLTAASALARCCMARSLSSHSQAGVPDVRVP